jgi:signal transduction histidine kinase
MQYLELARLWWNAPDPRQDEVEIDSLLDDLRTAAQQQVGSRPVAVRIFSPVAGATIRTDERKLRAILLQLLAHAIKFTPAGEVWVTVSLEETTTDFLVVDEGPSIDPRERDGGFDPFRQLRDDLGGAPGQGIGLALAQRLAALIGGSLDAVANRPRGTLLRLSLPLRASVGTPASSIRYH